MALSVGQVQNPTLTNAFTPSPTITSVGVAHPAPLTNNVQAPTPATPTSSAPAPDYSALIAAASAAPRQVYAPALDVNAIYGKASANAAANVNPYYTKLLNDFVGQQATTRQQQQQQTDVNIQNLQDQYKQIQEGNAVTGSRATEDAATSEANAAQAIDNRQVDQGTAFDVERNSAAVHAAAAGLTGSGLSAGTATTAQTAHDTAESRQAVVDQQTKTATELAKARTFEDLATSNKNAGTAETKGETQAKFDLNKFITGQTTDLQHEQQSLEQQRQQQLAQEKSNQTKLLVQKFINSIANPAQRQAALSAYGGLN